MYDSIHTCDLVATVLAGATVLAVTLSTLSLVATVLAVTALSLVATITIAIATRFHFYILL
jgi:hypothetical protein